ncbi:glycosyltransferase [Ancylothrix sp. C2]|uniref:glycosyltransferase family 2 protein n=1 Tax=Ancylothrix sp. D3o TaxID=2953691 RepID=UPI0021BAF488|nr:glycosyltransferase family 2 protein [Ancylothrix sp. D3o]MCT7950090.1 glycosyltransferase [Ancylothrix sp. D3o]
MPKVSVCIPTFNRVGLLRLAIESVVGQSYQDWELIVCDDGSTDGTADFMAGLSSDRRIHYIRHSHNIGKSNNMRSGFDLARGDYFVKFDDDDQLTSDFLVRTCEILDGYADVDFVGCDHWIIDVNNLRQENETELNSRRWGRSFLKAGIVDDLLDVVFVQQSFQVGATLFRREVLQAINFMLPNLQNCEDNDLFVRLALAGKKGYFLPERLMEYRVHAEQQGINRAIPYLQDKCCYLQRYCFESSRLEFIRKSRLAETQLILGLRLIERGESQEGRRLVWQGKTFSTRKAFLGLLLSFVPVEWRINFFELARKLKK